MCDCCCESDVFTGYILPVANWLPQRGMFFRFAGNPIVKQENKLVSGIQWRVPGGYRDGEDFPIRQPVDRQVVNRVLF